MRRAGVLLHPTSLPGGVLDENVGRFLDWMSRSGLSVWQILPLGVPHGDRSPYQTCSCHALNPALLPAGQTFSAALRPAFEQFAAQHADWLDDYACLLPCRNVLMVNPGRSGRRSCASVMRKAWRSSRPRRQHASTR